MAQCDPDFGIFDEKMNFVQFHLLPYFKAAHGYNMGI